MGQDLINQIRAERQSVIIEPPTKTEKSTHDPLYELNGKDLLSLLQKCSIKPRETEEQDNHLTLKLKEYIIVLKNGDPKEITEATKYLTSLIKGATSNITITDNPDGRISLLVEINTTTSTTKIDTLQINLEPPKLKDSQEINS